MFAMINTTAPGRLLIMRVGGSYLRGTTDQSVPARVPGDTRRSKRERFGWMLAWGNLAWVPFVYSLQAHYLVDHVHEIGVWATIALVSLGLAGYAIFRGANLQKHRFRENPEKPVWDSSPCCWCIANGAIMLSASQSMDRTGRRTTRRSHGIPGIYRS